MKRIYNNLLDRNSLSHDAEGLRMHNNMLSIVQRCHRLDRARLRKQIRMAIAKEASHG